MKRQKNLSGIKNGILSNLSSESKDRLGIKSSAKGKVSLNASEQKVGSDTSKNKKNNINNAKLIELDDKAIKRTMANNNDFYKGAKTISRKKKEMVIPDPSLAHKLGEGGQKLHEAVAELIDNSIDARTKEQMSGKEKLFVDVILDCNKKRFEIVDNAIGMTYDELVSSAILGKSNKTKYHLGSAGVGQKTALASLGHNYTITTGVKGEKIFNEYTYDQEKTTSWEREFIEFDKKTNLHGTKIEVPLIDKIEFNEKKIEALKKIMAKRYYIFLANKDVVISVNGELLAIEELDWADPKYPIPFKIKVVVERTGKIFYAIGKIGLLREGNQGNLYGFDLYRNNRMIEINSKFGLNPHPTISRIMGEIHLDFVRVAYSKNQFIEDSAEYEAAFKACAKSDIFKEVVAEAKKSKSSEDLNKAKVNASQALDEFAPLLQISLDNDEFADLPRLSDEKVKIFVQSSIGDIDNLNMVLSDNKRSKYQKRGKTGTKTKVVPTPNNSKNYRSITIKGNKLNWIDDYYHSIGGSKKIVEFDAKKNLLVININTAYADYVNRGKDTGQYVCELIRDSLVEYKYKGSESNFLKEVNDLKDIIANKCFNLQGAKHILEKNKNLPSNEILNIVNDSISNDIPLD